MAYANKLLQGANWATAGDWTTSGLPATADDVRVNDTARDILTGDQGGIDLHGLLIPSRYVGSFGSSGSPLKIACGNGTNPRVEYRGRGGLYYESYLGGTFL